MIFQHFSSRFWSIQILTSLRHASFCSCWSCSQPAAPRSFGFSAALSSQGCPWMPTGVSSMLTDLLKRSCLIVCVEESCYFMDGIGTFTKGLIAEGYGSVVFLYYRTCVLYLNGQDMAPQRRCWDLEASGSCPPLWLRYVMTLFWLIMFKGDLADVFCKRRGNS